MAQVTKMANWRGEQILRAVQEIATDRCARAAMDVAEVIRREVGVQGPPSSKPGEYPHRRTGELQQSISVEVDQQAVEARIVAEAPHAADVEAKRPFLVRGLKENVETVKHAFKGRG